MNFGEGAGTALECTWRWYYSLPLLSENLLFQALPAKTCEYPELPAAILAELFLRRWLYPQPPESNGEWLERLAPYMHRSRFAGYYAEWAASQANERTYEIPEAIPSAAANKLEYVLAQTLRDGFLKWEKAHGTIAFLCPGITPDEDQWENTPPLADILLPFCLINRNLHEPTADFGKRAAIAAQKNISNLRIDLDKVFLNFPTLPTRLPKWMEGESGALAIWFALCADEFEIPRKALDVGLAGCCSEIVWLSYRSNPGELVRRKWNLFRRARVPVIVLPDTMGDNGPGPDECTLWPLNQPLGPRMEDLLTRQMAPDSDAMKLKRIESCLIEGEEGIDLEAALGTLVEMESKRMLSAELARRINIFAYICCCRLRREPEATVREKRILELPCFHIHDFPGLLRSAVNSEATFIRFRALAAILKNKCLGINTQLDLIPNQNKEENESERQGKI